METFYKLVSLAEYNGVKIRLGDYVSRSKAGIHLARPSDVEMEKAIDQAVKDAVATIWVYLYNNF